MKKTKLIIPAMGLLLLSTAASVSGTVAWFSMNAQVTATGMTISAKSDTSFLIIQAGTSFDNTLTGTSADTHATEAELYPVAPAITLTSGNVSTPGSWHYAYSNSTTVATASTDYTACTTLTGYVGSESFMIGLNQTSGVDSSANYLRLSALTLPADTGISCVIVCGSVINNYTANLSTPLDLGVKANKTGTRVDVYYYINGEDSHVYSANATNLTGTVSMTFDINAAA